MKAFLAGIVVSLASISAAQAHTHLLRSEPAENSILMVAPRTVTLEFAKPIKLTAAALHKGELKLQDLGPLSTDASAKFTLALPGKVDSGVYSVRFRGVSDDQHFMSGKLSFTVRSKHIAQ